MPAKNQPTPQAEDVIPDNEAIRKIQELSAKLESLEKKLAEKDQAIQVQAAEIKELKAQEEGWLVTTPNTVYDGDTLGVKFHNGQAFISAKHEFPAFQLEPMKPTSREKYLAQFTLPGTRQEAEKSLGEREKMTTAQRLVETLSHDFGYTVEWFDAERLAEVQGRVQTRAREAAMERARLAELSQNEKLFTPHVMR